MARSLNSVQLIGNLTRDPELRYTPQGTAVATFGVATNRTYTTNGEKKDETEFHNIVAWNKLAELCSQLLTKGRKVYVHGRLTTRKWTGQDGAQRNTTEIVIDDMMILDSRREGASTQSDDFDVNQDQPASMRGEPAAPRKSSVKAEKEEHAEEPVAEDVNLDDIPF